MIYDASFCLVHESNVNLSDNNVNLIENECLVYSNSDEESSENVSTGNKGKNRNLSDRLNN